MPRAGAFPAAENTRRRRAEGALRRHAFSAKS